LAKRRAGLRSTAGSGLSPLFSREALADSGFRSSYRVELFGFVSRTSPPLGSSHFNSVVQPFVFSCYPSEGLFVSFFSCDTSRLFVSVRDSTLPTPLPLLPPVPHTVANRRVFSCLWISCRNLLLIVCIRKFFSTFFPFSAPPSTTHKIRLLFFLIFSSFWPGFFVCRFPRTYDRAQLFGTTKPKNPLFLGGYFLWDYFSAMRFNSPPYRSFPQYVLRERILFGIFYV